MKNFVRAMLLTAAFALTIGVSASVNGVAANPTPDSLSSVESTSRDVESPSPATADPGALPSAALSDGPMNTPQSSSELPENSEQVVEQDTPADPETEGYVGGMNGHEMAYCAWPPHFQDCFKANETRHIAEDEAKKRFPHSVNSGLGDAFRHCAWTAMMAHRMGNGLAENFASMHEQGAEQSREAFEMDQRNNGLGIHIVSPRTRNDHEILEKCQHMAHNHGLWHISHGKLVK